MLVSLARYGNLLAILGALLTAGGCAAAYHLPGFWRNSKALARKPISIPVHELATEGIRDTAYVNVTQYVCGDDFAFEMSRRRGDPPATPNARGFCKAWIPLSPRDDPPAAHPSRVVVLLETSSTVATPLELRERNQKQSVSGLAMPIVQRQLKPEIRKQLSESYPDSDFQNLVLVRQYEPYEIEDAPDFAMLLAASTAVGFLLGLPMLGLGTLLRFSKKKVSPSGNRRRTSRTTNRRAVVSPSADFRPIPEGDSALLDKDGVRRLN